MNSTRLATALVLAMATATVPACRRESQSYHPLAAGTHWEYRVSERAQHRDRPEQRADGEIFTETVLPARELNGRTVIPLQADMLGHKATSFVVERRDGIYAVARQELDQQEIKTHDVPQCLLPYPPVKEVTCDLEAPELYETTEFKLTGVAHIEADDEVVTVPAGIYHNCLRIRAEASGSAHLPDRLGTVSMKTEEIQWWAPGVGMVKTQLKQEMDPKSFGWGTRTMELVSFKSG